MFTISNTLSGKKEQFTPLKHGAVTLYACGITPYDQAHIGHGRSAISFDVLYRWLIFLGYDVVYTRNFTDIDDKLLKKAQDQLGNQHLYKQVADKYISQYNNEVGMLNCVIPTHEPRVTDHIPEIIDFIQELIDKGYAYQTNKDVYFEIKKFPEYGKLSKQNIDELRSGARIEVDARKKDPLDFALWKSEPEGTFWKSPWGYGRPGWHIECSALAARYLGENIDIHGGGRDLMFPHHENEIAQSEAHFHKPFARYWVHNGLVNIGKEKMSKSLGNILSLHDLCRDYNPMVLRYYFLQHHYHSPLEFSFEDLEGAAKSYRKLCNVFEHTALGVFDLKELKEMPIITRMIDFLADDINTAGLIGVVFEQLDVLRHDDKQRSAAKQVLHDVLGLSLVPIEAVVEITPEIQSLLTARELARAAKDFKKADTIRDQLKALGFEVKDQKSA